MAPDVVSREGFKRVNYDERCDVWSCGALLLVVLCGALPPTDFWRRGLSPDFVKSWMAKSGNTFSQELMDFLLRGIFVERKARMSTAQLLEHPWLAGPSASDEEWAHELVRRNRARVKLGIEMMPKHVGLFENPAFHSALVGSAVHGDENAGRYILQSLGLSKYMNEIANPNSLDDFEDIDVLEIMSRKEAALLGNALRCAGKSFDWIQHVLN